MAEQSTATCAPMPIVLAYIAIVFTIFLTPLVPLQIHFAVQNVVVAVAAVVTYAHHAVVIV